MRRCFILSAIIASSLLAGCQTIQQHDSGSANPKLTKTVWDKIFSAEPLSGKSRKKPVNGDTATESPDDLWELTRQNLQLTDESQHEDVNTQIVWYSNYPTHMQHITENAAPYYHYVLNEVLKRGLPAELALLPAVESSYNPEAYSSGHAAGLWQFIPSTAKYKGLKKSRWYDGRKDIIDSTSAALDYLEHLNNRFNGDWLLTMAAYNAGGGTVSRAIRKNREAGKPIDFWSLSLPRETRLYVPRILAIASFVRQPDRYHMNLPIIKNEPYFEVIATGGQVNLAQAALMSGTRLAEVQQLNPGMLRLATDPAGPHRLLVPEDNAQQLRSALNDLTQQARTQWAEYKIQPGDSLSEIAEMFDSSIATIKTANQLPSNRLRAGKTLIIPQDTTIAALSGKTPTNASTATSTPAKKTVHSALSIYQYTVKTGDTLWGIAQNHHVNVELLSQWNNISAGDTLNAGKELRIGALPSSVIKDEAEALQQIGYEVRSGDSLWTIAGRYNIHVDDIKEWNNLNSSSLIIQPGQQLTLFVNES
ncbi:LysM peptidoglycan-binding domain-containing protein [Neptunomonas antarctica]|uniref:Membrane-bound lytic murein transglycosylase D n=1 Tax=Neptunomonas antarctica TaxID=619304 RepID=A0A1N7LSQ3_9GAMM|nr:LysM peptidoglycan-binding domain-containing protein [Neptunomonas antarctica]SIS76731.1 membrane-bound lytic murein transglycosylase D [Neptunomonas antarctica]